MEATQLYKQLEDDFISPGLSDEWAQYMNFIADFICDNFKKRSMGLVCDFAKDINRVYTAVFPSEEVMEKIIDEGREDAMLFVHHPSIWDIRNSPEVFHQMEIGLLKQFKERRVSIYNLHVPLDDYGEYSTSVTLAKVLNIKPKKSFAPYFGAMAGVFGKTNLLVIQQLRKKFQKAVGHEVSLYNYGSSKIKDGIVAIIAGGGNDVDMLKEIDKEGVNTLIGGVTVRNNYSKKAHKFARRRKINILGGTHYSTEKFACIKMVEYFKKIGIPSEFIEDKPLMEDM